MSLLYRHLRKHARLVFLALACAGANQLFLLLDPLILRRIIDGYALQARRWDAAGFFRHVGLLLAAAIAAMFLAWLARNYQIDFVNRVARYAGMGIYSEGIGHSLGMPYSAFEDRRSGEIMSTLQAARHAVETFIVSSVNSVFSSLIATAFLIVYAARIHWILVPAYLVALPCVFFASVVLSRKVRAIQVTIVREATRLAGSATESLRNIELVKSLGLAGREVWRLGSAGRCDSRTRADQSALHAPPQLLSRSGGEPGPVWAAPAYAISGFQAADHHRAVLRAIPLLLHALHSHAGDGWNPEPLRRD